MQQSIYPCIWFNGNAKEATTFYTGLFEGGQLLSENPMVIMFELAGQKFMALNGGPMFTLNPSISLYVQNTSAAQTTALHAALMQGGKEMMPLGKYNWNDHYAWVEDKYGLSWQLTTETEQPSQTIQPCLLFAGKNLGNAQNAVELYTNVFIPSNVHLMLPYDEASGHGGKVLFSTFTLNGFEMIAMDGPGEHNMQFNEGVSLVVECANQQQIDYYWKQLTGNGGQESRCGWLKDKFGISWQIIPDKLGTWMNDTRRKQRVGEKLMAMKKLDYDQLQNA